MRKYIIKRYSDDPIYVSQTVGEAVKTAWENGTKVISIPGNKTLSASSISAVEETMSNEEPTNLLGSGKEILGDKPIALKTEQGFIVMKWYKKLISLNEWEKYFSKNYHYHKFVGISNELWVAMRLPEHTKDTGRSQDLVMCSKDEIRVLNANT